MLKLSPSRGHFRTIVCFERTIVKETKSRNDQTKKVYPDFHMSLILLLLSASPCPALGFVDFYKVFRSGHTSRPFCKMRGDYSNKAELPCLILGTNSAVCGFIFRHPLLLTLTVCSCNPIRTGKSRFSSFPRSISSSYTWL